LIRFESRHFTASVLAFGLAIGCQGILGIEDPTPRDVDPAFTGSTGGSGTGGTAAGGSGSSGGSVNSGGTQGGDGGDGSVDPRTTGGGGGVASGGTGGSSTSGGSTGDGGAPSDGGSDGGPPEVPLVSINEVESNAGTPGDWVELYNSGTAAIDLSGYVFTDGSQGNTFRIPSGSLIAPGGFLVLEEAAFGFGLGSNDSALLFRPDGTTLVSSFTWSNHALATYGACPDGSRALSANATSTKGAANDCTPYVLINEVESNGGTPGDWVELHNATLVPADVSGWIFRDNDDTHGYVIPPGTIIQPGRFLVLDEAVLGFGFAAEDSARLFLPDGAKLVDSYLWSTHATTTYGRCPAAGPFLTTLNPTKNAPNACSGQTTLGTWPGGNATASVDAPNQLGGNISGLVYEPGTDVSDDVLWAVRNAPSSLFRLKDLGATWGADPIGGWADGKDLRYPNSGGEPDAEGITRTAFSLPEIYVAAERDNTAGQAARFSVLRYDTSSPTTFLVATHEWNLTAELPAAEANRGLEGIAWLPDAYLTARGFLDEGRSKTYAPADYPDHGTGLFVVALETNGMLYVYALNHADGTTHRVATIATGQTNVNDVQLDRDVGYLWSYCGASCTNLATILTIDEGAASPTRGKFVVRATVQAPSTLGSFTNEGISFAPDSRCAGGFKAFFWADDEAMGGHALYEGTIPCGAFLP
jgi:hypothetical protein